MSRRGGAVAATTAATIIALLVSGCSARGELSNPVRLELTNRSGKAVTGALLRFDRELARADLVSDTGFTRIKLRLAPANTLRMEGGLLAAGASVAYEVEGEGGPPRLLDGRWLVDGRLGRLMTKDEFDVR